MNTAFKVKEDPKNNTKNKMILKILTAQKVNIISEMKATPRMNRIPK